MAFDSDTPFPLQVHTVEHLRLQVFSLDGLGELQQTVRQRTFAVVYMCNNTKIAYILHLTIILL